MKTLRGPVTPLWVGLTLAALGCTATPRAPSVAPASGDPSSGVTSEDEEGEGDGEGPAVELGRRCAGGEGWACAELGALREPADARARELFARGCELGDAVACGRLAVVLREGLGGPADLAAARGAFERGCELGDAFTCVSLARALLEGPPSEAERERALDLLRGACEVGEGMGCVGLALTRDDPGARVELLARACELDEGVGCDALGKAVHGEDRARAAAAFERGCELDQGSSCAALAAELAGSEPARAAELYARGCELRTPLACTYLGVSHERGAGVELDLDRAEALYRQACKADEPRGCLYLAVLLIKRDPEANEAGAEAALTRACELGHAEACELLRRATGAAP